jgi:hypothetical protein
MRSGTPGLERETTRDMVSPRTPAEELVAGVWSSLLGVEPIGIYDNLFELGVSSMLANHIVARLRAIFRVDLPLRSLFERPTIDETVGVIAEMWGGREIVEEIAWTFAQVQQLSEVDKKKMLADPNLDGRPLN